MTYRPHLLLVLLGLLSGCAVYDHVFHPHRLGNPPMTAAAKAKAKAAEKARHKGLTLGAPAADGSAQPASADGASADGADGTTAPSPADAAKSANDKNKAIEDMLGNTYDTKTGLLKRSRLQRMQYSSRQLHHYNLDAPPHTDATRDARRMRKHPKGQGSDKAAGSKAPRENAEAADPGFTPDPTQPTAAPAAKTTVPKAATPGAAPKPAKAPLAKTPAPRPVKAAPAKPKVKVDKAAAEKAKQEKLRAGGETVDKPVRAPKEAKEPKDKKAPKAPKPDPTQPLTGQD